MIRRILCIVAAILFLPAVAGSRAEESGKEGAETVVNGAAFQDQRSSRDQHRVFYEIFVGSFSDSNGDGIGDLRGIINRMDYLNDGRPESGESLGVEGLWLTPVFASPSYHKYDITDYETIDPAFGTQEDLKELIALCHQRDVLLILDLPLNHTGMEHPWFRRFLNAHQTGSVDNVYYDWYSWLPLDETPPAGKTFVKLASAGIQYEANFSRSMPELNFDHPPVREAVLEIGRRYLEMGVDGFRFDAAKYPYYGEHDKNIALWGWYTGELKKLNPEVYTVAEVWDGEGVTNRYAVSVNCFHFETSQAEGLIAETARAGDVNRLTLATQKYLDTLAGISPDAMNIPFIANHDTDRAAGYLPMAGGRMAMAANLYLLTPGSPFIYYGEEIGLRGARGGSNTDANRRLRMLWGDGDPVQDPPGATYSKQSPYTVKELLAMKGSLIHHYKKLLTVRKAHPEIARGTYTALELKNTKMGGFICEWNGSRAAVFHNTTGKELSVHLKDVTDCPFTSLSAVLEAVPGEGGASLEGDVLTLGPQTSAVLR